MRKSFTRFLGLFTLFCVLGFQVSIAGVNKLVPENANGNVAKTTGLAITFDYALSQGSAYNGAVIQLKSAGVLVDQINVPSARFTFSADMKTINMEVQATLLENTAYYVEFPANVVKENNPDGTFTSNPVYTGAGGLGSWSFTVGDFSKPTLAASPFVPATGAINVGSAAPSQSTCNFTLTFGENVKGVVGKYIKIYNSLGEIHEMIDASVYTVANTVVSFTTTKLRENTSYYVLVDAGAFIDNSTNKNAFDGITSKTAWTFTTRDYVAPVVTTGYPKTSSVTSTSFNVLTKLDEKGTFKIIVYDKLLPNLATPTTWADFVTGGNAQQVAVSAANTEFSIGVTKYYDQFGVLQNLVDSKTYIVYYISQNEAKFGGAPDPLTTVVKSFEVSTIDQINPGTLATYPKLLPLNNATDIAKTLDASSVPNSTLSIEFEEKVKAGAGNIIIYNAIDNTIFESIDVTNTSKVTFASSSPWVVKIKPAGTLASLKTYYIKIADGVIVDNSNNKFAGYSLDNQWRFTAIDYEVAIPTWSAPAANSLLAKLETVKITFNENVFSAAGGATAFTAGTAATTIVVEKDNVVQSTANYTYAATVNSISVTPIGAGFEWDENSTYVVKVLKNTIYDSKNNLITKELVKSYKVDSWKAPTATFDPVAGTVPSTQSFKVKFSENVALAGGTAITDSNVASLITFVENGGPSIAFTATWSAADKTATVVPVSALNSSKTYTITLSAGYQDMNVTGGAISAAGITTAVYIVSDSVVPTVELKTTATGANMEIKFSEPIFKADGTTAYSGLPNDLFNFITLRANSATGAIVNLNPAIAVAGNTYTINPAAPLTPGSTYYLAFANASVYDATPSKNPNIGNSTTFVVSKAPALVSTTPAHKATGVSTGTNSVSLTFDKSVKRNDIGVLGIGLGSTVLNLYESIDGGTTWLGPVASTIESAVTFVGSSATFPIAYGFSSQNKYRVNVLAGAVLDADNNASNAIAAADFEFTIQDLTMPFVSSYIIPCSPGAPVSDANLSKKIAYTFSEEMKRGSGTITITDGGTFNQIIDVNSSLITFKSDNKTVYIDHTAFVSNGVIYTLSWPIGTFKDLSNNNIPAESDVFATDPNVLPQFDAASSFPIHLSDKNTIGTDLIIKFNEPISIADGNKKVTIYLNGVVTIAQSYKLSESNVTVSGNTIAVALVDLAANSTYNVELEAGGVKDQQGATNLAITPPAWTFYTGNFNGPKATFTVAGTVVGGAMQNVDRTANIVITFDEAARLQSGATMTSLNLVDASAGIGVGATKAIKLTTGGNGVAMEASIDAANRVITIPASTIFGYNAATNAVYTLYVDNIQDMDGKNAPIQSYTFTIDDYTAPVAVATYPKISENKLGTQIVLDLLYNEKVNAYYQLLAKGSTKPTAASLKANGTLATVNSTATKTSVTIPTAASSEYELFVVAADLPRNTLQLDAAVTQITIKTADIVDPVIATYGSNLKPDVDPALPFAIKLTFAANVTLATGNIFVFDATNNALVATLNQTNCAVSGKDLTITIAAATLNSNSSYYLNITKGLVTDEWTATQPVPDVNTKAANNYAGLFDATTYTFKTKDTVPPVVSSASPFAASTTGIVSNVTTASVNQDLVLTFNENILTSSIGSGDIIIREGIAGPVREVVLLTNSATTNISGKVLTINPIMSLLPTKTYEIELKANAVKDAAGNGNLIAKWSFVVEDINAPVVSFLVNPTLVKLTAAPVALATVIDINFDEPALLLNKSVVVVADVDSLVSLTDATGKALAFSSAVTATDWVITPAAAFKSNSSYTISFGAIVRDAAGNNVPAQSVTFTTKLTTSPDIIFAPLAKVANVDKGASIVITSSRKLVLEETTIGGGVALGFFKELGTTDNPLSNYIKVGLTAGANDVAFNATIDADKKVITVKPVIDMVSNRKYFFEFNPLGNDNIAQGLYPDIVDQNNIQVTVPSSITNGTANRSEFTVIDYEAPILAVSNNSPNNAYLNSGSKLTLEFNEDVIPGTGDIKIYREDGVLIETIAVTDATKVNVKSGNTKMIEINPSVAARTNNTKYYVIVPLGVIIDKSPLKNQYAGLLDNTKWIYYTADTQNPVVSLSGLYPANGATNVFVYENLVATFDKEVTLTGSTGNVSVYKKGGDAFDFIQVPSAGVKIAIDPIDKKKMTVNFDRILDQNTEYYVTMEKGTVVNVLNASATFDGFMNNSTWTFTTENTDRPKIVTTVPADDAVGVAYLANQTLQMTFDMPVAKGTGSVRVVQTSTGTLIEKIDVAATSISEDMKTVSVPMTVRLNDDIRYHVFVDGGSYTSILPSKASFLGINAYDVWNFTTVKDGTLPTATFAPNATIGLTLYPALSLTFSEPIAAGTGKITIYKASDNTSVVTLDATVTGSTATFAIPVTVPATLKDNTKYYVKVGADAFKDKATTPNFYLGIADATTWTFTTGDNSAPVATYAPIGNNEKAAVTLTMTFDEEVVAGAGTLTLYSAANVAVKEFTVAELTINGKVVTAPQITGLVDNTTYYVKASAGLVKDKAANGPFNFIGISNATDWTFKVGDNTVPTIVTVLPVDKTQKLAKTFNVVITFSEKVSGVDATTLVVTGGVINTVTPDVAGIVYTVSITAPSLADVTLTVPVTVKDMNLNALATAAVYTYKVDDFSTPTLIGWTPKDGSLEIKADTALIMTFSKPIYVGTVAATTPMIYVYNSLNQLFKSYTITGLNIVDKVVTVPVKGLKDHETYVVTFDADIVEDYYKVPVVALADPTVWNFTTGDNTAPTVVVDPATATAAKNTFDVTLTFSEDVLNVAQNVSVTNGTVTVTGSGKSYVATVKAVDGAIVVMTIGTGIKDLSLRNHLATVAPITYTVGDNTAPTIISVLPLDKTVKLAKTFDVVLTFSEKVSGVSATTLVATNGVINTVTPDVAGKVYTVNVTAPEKAVVGISIPNTVADVSGNKFAGASLTYTVGDFTAPVVTAVSTVLVNDLTVVLTISADAIVTSSDITVTGATSSDITNVGNVYTVKAKAKDNAVVVVAVAATVADAAGNKIAGVTSFSNTIGDNTAPILTVTAPKAPIKAPFTVGLSFDEVVTGISMSTITVTNGTLVSVTGSGKDYVLTADAAEKAVVGIAIPTVADAAGNKLVGKSLEYTVGDFTNPTVTATPSAGVSLKNTFTVVLTFSDDAILTAGDIIVTGAKGTPVITNVKNVYTVAITADDVAQVVVSVASTVADAAGNKLAGTSSFIYKVGDNTAPTLDIAGPSAPIDPSFIVSLNFSEVVTGFDKSALTVTNGTIKQFAGSGANYLVSINATEKAVVTIAVKADGITDAAGNKFAGKTATFTVGDFTAPKVVVTPPVSPVATVFSIGLKFDEAVTGLILGGTGVSVTNGKIVDITGKNDSYTIVVSALEMTAVKVVLSNVAIADIAGNKFAGQTLDYTTGDFTAPAIVTMTPTLETVLTDNHPIFGMTFSENVKKGAGGNLTVYKVQTTTPVLTIPITEEMIAGKNVTVSYKAINGLDKSARYYVLVDGAALTDNAGNAFAGVSDVAAWTFKTGDKFVTKIEPNSSLEFKVYPNPFVDFVNVANASKLSKIVVTNIAGQVVKEVVAPSDRIQLNELRSGIYFMSLYNTEDVIVKTAKIVKR